MTADKKRLMTLLCEAHNISYEASLLNDATYAQQLGKEAEHLISNGVTFAKDTNVPIWIPASEPPKEWKDENGDTINYLIFAPDIGIDIGNWIEPMRTWFCLGVPFNITHWMPLPEPPKEGSNEQ